MKRFLSLIIASVFFLSVFSFAVAASPDFTKEEAIRLFSEAYTRTYVMYLGIADNSNDAFLGKDIMDFGGKSINIHFTHTTDGRELYEDSGDYREITDERFDTMEECTSYLEEVFTAEKARQILGGNPYSAYGYLYPDTVRLSDGGIERGNYGGTGKPPVSAKPGKVVRHEYTDGGEYLGEAVSAGEFSVHGDRATLEINYRKYNRYGSKEESMDVSFEKTDSGWRISGGEFFDYHMKSGKYTLKNPNTSDYTFLFVLTIPILSAVFILSIRKKRRITE